MVLGELVRRFSGANVGVQAGSGSSTKIRSRCSRYPATVWRAGLSRSPAVAASRIVAYAAYAASVAVAAQYAVSQTVF